MRNLLVPFGLKPKKVNLGPRYGDVNDRNMAAVIDVMLLYLLLGKISDRIMKYVFAYFHQQPLGYDNVHANSYKELIHVVAQLMWDARWPLGLTYIITTLMMGVLMVAFQLAYETTPGKWLLGLKIVRYKTLEPVARWRYIARFLGYYVSAAPIMLGFLWMNFNKQRRGFHDYIAGTVVINTRPQGWYWNHVKRGYRKLRGKPQPLPVEQSVSEPAAEKRHGDGDKPVE